MEKPSSEFVLCFISGILIFINSIVLGFLAVIMPVVLPTLTGQYAPQVSEQISTILVPFTASIVLYTLMGIGFVFSVVILFGSITF